MIPKEFIQKVLEDTDITSVIGAYVKLKGFGPNMSGLCPFHKEKSPSFTVAKQKQFYHCFGCGSHGNAIGFLMDHVGLDFPSAVENLATRIGLEVPKEALSEEDLGKEQEKQSLFEVMEQVQNHYYQGLFRADKAKNYLKGRGLSGHTAKQFGIGYAPGMRYLAELFSNYDQSTTLNDLGLQVSQDSGSRIDRFRDRVTFPIRDGKGRIMGFGARVLDDTKPKYLNSPETFLFSKGQELYGLYENKTNITKKSKALVVEGYMDVVSLSQFGVDYAVATLGTAVTGFHISKLSKLCSRVIFCFDGDEAGQRAAWRAAEAVASVAQDTKRYEFLILDKEHDPDSYIQAFGLEAFEAMTDKALPLSVFITKVLKQRFDVSVPESRTYAVNDIKPLVQKMPAGLYRGAFIKHLASELLLEEEVLLKALGFSKIRTLKSELKTKSSVSIEAKIIGYLIENPSWAQYTIELEDHYRQSAFLSEEQRQFFNVITQMMGKKIVQPGILFEVFRDQVEEKIVENAIQWAFSSHDEKDHKTEFIACVHKLSEKMCSERMKALIAQGLQSDEDQEKYMALQKKRQNNKKSIADLDLIDC